MFKWIRSLFRKKKEGFVPSIPVMVTGTPISNYNDRSRCHECKFDAECHGDKIYCKDYIFKYDRIYEEKILESMRKKMQEKRLIERIEKKSW